MATETVATMAILAGIYSGSSSVRNDSGPKMFPRQNDIRTIAFMVTFLVWPATLAPAIEYSNGRADPTQLVR